MNLYLKRLTPYDGPDIYALAKAILGEENRLVNFADGFSREEYKAWLQRQYDISLGISLEEGRVPQTTYWFYDEDKPVGMCKLRTALSPALLKRGGHIGYVIAPDCRGKGYGKEQLRLILQEAKKQGMTKVLITARNENKASIRVALSNGGIIEKVSDEDHYIWINLA
jgi:predicted acetyltransferase